MRLNGLLLTNRDEHNVLFQSIYMDERAAFQALRRSCRSCKCLGTRFSKISREVLEISYLALFVCFLLVSGYVQPPAMARVEALGRPRSLSFHYYQCPLKHPQYCRQNGAFHENSLVVARNNVVGDLAIHSQMRPFTVPTISVANTRNNLDIIQEIRDACLLHGFFQVIDHDVPLPLIDRTFATTKAFFELPVESKQSVLKTDHIVGGYEPFRVYNLSTSEPNRRANYGCNEGFAIAPEWGKNQFVSDDILPDFEKDCSDYFRAVAQLGRRLLSTIAEGLNVPGNFFEPYLDHQLSFCRLTHYYRESLAPPGEEEPIGAAAHSDWGSLTVLVQDEIGGLQVFDRSSDTWFDVSSPSHKDLSYSLLLRCHTYEEHLCVISEIFFLDGRMTNINQPCIACWLLHQGSIDTPSHFSTQEIHLTLSKSSRAVFLKEKIPSTTLLQLENTSSPNITQQLVIQQRRAKLGCESDAIYIHIYVLELSSCCRELL